jgi:hypothetical protein
MKKQILLLIVLLASVATYSQKPTFTSCNIDIATSRFSSDLSYYTSYGSNSIQREKFLDSVAEVRVNYFYSVLQETGKSFCLYDLTSNIPKDSRGHSRYFGKPELFKEPSWCKYPTPLPLIKERSTKVTAEIMQQTTWTKTTEYKYTDEQLIDKALSAMEKGYGKDFILAGYKKSTSHRNAIKNYAKGAYGSCTKAIISKKRNELENVWIYEVVVYNLTIFSKPF